MPASPLSPRAPQADPAPSPAEGSADASAATQSAGCGSSCADSHDHAGHDHGPTGADIVAGLGSGLAVVSLVIPALAVVMVLGILAYAPLTPLPILLGIALGGAHLLVLVLLSQFVTRIDGRLATSPLLLGTRSVVEELLRLAAVLVALLLWPADRHGALGLWIGAGAALVWMGLATIQTISARRRIASPSDWSKNAVATLLAERVSVRRSMSMRVLDVVGAVCFQLGATMLIAMSSVMVAGTIALSIATGLSTLVLHRRSSAERARSAWAYAPLGVGVLALALGVLGLATTGSL